MHILANPEGGRITLQPSNGDERVLLLGLKEELETVGCLGYGGRTSLDDDRLAYLTFKRSRGAEFRLTPTDDRDRDCLGLIRNAIYFGGGVMTFRGSFGHDTAEFEIYFTLAQCKDCLKDIITMGEVEWRTCRSCKATCEHEWEEGFVHGGSAGNVAKGHYCGKCGIGKPEEVVQPLAGPGGFVVLS